MIFLNSCTTSFLTKIHTWPQGRAASCSSFPVGTVPLPDLSFNPPVHWKILLLWSSGFRGTLFHNGHELLFPQITYWVNTRYIMYEWPVSFVNKSVCYVKVSISISPNGLFAGFHWECVTRLFQGNVNSNVVELPSDGITLQFTSCEETDISTRSNRVELPELLMCMGRLRKYKTL